MPPPHLHPKSRMTSSLFMTTIIASFFVVGLPHVLPCPAPRVTFADGEMIDENGRRRRRRKPQNAEVDKDGMVQFESMSTDAPSPQRGTARECPVPKPRGMLGELLGFGKDEHTQTDVRR